MLASGVLGVLVALALSARAEEPAPAPEAGPPNIVVVAQPELASSDQLWLDRFEDELAGTSPAELVVEAARAEALLRQSEALETLYAKEIGAEGRAQLSRIESHLLRLGVWREPVR